MIEGDRPADLGFRELEVGGDAADGLVGDAPGPGLDVADDVEEGRGVLGMLEDDVFLWHGQTPFKVFKRISVAQTAGQ